MNDGKYYSNNLAINVSNENLKNHEPYSERAHFLIRMHKIFYYYIFLVKSA